MWWLFSLFTLCLGGYLGARFFEGDKRFLVPGTMTRGHHQIESECAQCHTPMLGVAPDACAKCHAEELERIDDSHPPSKFEDPRNADRLAKLDARHCIACHIEHRPELTAAMGVTQPVDVCRHCHEDIGSERPTHAGLAFSTCQDSGCHNFHDNRALHEDYLEQHLGDATWVAPGHVPEQTRGQKKLAASEQPPLTAAQQNAPAHVKVAQDVLDDWAQTAHARARINCQDCHAQPGKPDAWLERPGLDSCKRCHQDETAGFLGGMHGMRQAVGLSPMQPHMAQLPMQKAAAQHELGCNSCHDAHRFDRKQAAVDACLGCHADEHSLAYRDSKHYALFQRELTGQAPAGSGVSCATCHLPRAATLAGGSIRVQHNQNDFLRPNDKQIDSVCRHCHSIEFAIDALSDPPLIARGVNGTPSRHVRGLDMVRDRRRARQQAQAQAMP